MQQRRQLVQKGLTLHGKGRAWPRLSRCAPAVQNAFR